MSEPPSEWEHELLQPRPQLPLPTSPVRVERDSLQPQTLSFKEVERGSAIELLPEEPMRTPTRTVEKQTASTSAAKVIHPSVTGSRVHVWLTVGVASLTQTDVGAVIRALESALVPAGTPTAPFELEAAFVAHRGFDEH
jgi:hypothetical protein